MDTDRITMHILTIPIGSYKIGKEIGRWTSSGNTKERENKMTTNETGKKTTMKHNFTVAYIGCSGTIRFRDTYTFTNNKGLTQAKNQLLQEITEDEEGNLDDFQSIYRGVEEVVEEVA